MHSRNYGLGPSGVKNLIQISCFVYLCLSVCGPVTIFGFVGQSWYFVSMYVVNISDSVLPLVSQTYSLGVQAPVPCLTTAIWMKPTY